MTEPQGRWSARQTRVGMRRRAVLVALFAAVFVVFAGRLVWVQIVKGPSLAEAAQDDRTRTYQIDAPRGDILDSTGQVLATSVERVNVGVNQIRIAQYRELDSEGNVIGSGAEAVADQLAPLLGIDEAELGGMMVGTDRFTYIVRGLTPTQWRAVRDLGISGIEPEWITDRVYPNGTTAGNVVGFVGTDGYGLAGLEQYFNTDLSGIAGHETVEIGAGGQVIPTGTNEIVAAEPGDVIHTTINRDVQYIAQGEADRVVAENGAAWAGVAVVEIGTGNLVALADSGTVDPANPGASDAADRGARSVTAPYEPGSTGKLLTIAAAVNEGLVDASTVFSVDDEITLDGETFSDPGTHGHLELTTAGILAISSNVGTVQVGDLLDDQTRYEYMQAFGFGSPTGVQLPGESAGILTPPDTWDRRSRFATMFGQAYAVTLVQNVAMVATIGNGGLYVPPTLVDSLERADGSTWEPALPDTRQVITPETADTMIAMMEGVVQDGGTGERAAIEGYRVAGKTGTAETTGADGTLSEVVANFVGIVPADNPRFAIAVAIYTPQTGVYGGVIGAPVFQHVAEFTLHTYGVPPSTGSPPMLPWDSAGNTTIDYY